MKHIKFIWLAFITLTFTLCIFSSCSKDDDQEQSPSQETKLVGTKWTITYSGTKYIVEFKSDTDVCSYEADINNNYTNYLNEGKYTFDGKNITFTDKNNYFMNVIGIAVCHYYYFTSAEVNGNTMSLNTNEVKLIVSTSSVTKTDMGTKPFTLMKLK